MRFFCIAWLLLFGTSVYAQQAQLVRITGDWNDRPGRKVRLLIPADFSPDQYLVLDSALLTKTRRFHLDFRLSHATEAYLDCGELELPLYLNPGDQLTLQLQTGEKEPSINFSGPGSLVNNYLAQRSLRLTRLEKARINALKFKPDRFLRTIDSLAGSEETALQKHFITPVPLSPDEFSFLSWQSRQLRLDNATDKLRYAVIADQRKAGPLPFDLQQVVANATAPRTGEPIGYSYLQYAEALVEFKLLLASKRSVSTQSGWRPTTSYQIIKEEFHGPVRVGLLDKLIRRQAAQTTQRTESEALLAVLTKDREAPAMSIFLLQRSLAAKPVKKAVSVSTPAKSIKSKK